MITKNPREKALELVRKFKLLMYCYMGSGMLTNEYDVDVAVSYAKQSALIAVEQIREAIEMPTPFQINYLFDLEQEIKSITSNLL